MLVGSPEKESLRNEVACLQNQIEQTRVYAQCYNDEQKQHLIEEAQHALAFQREYFRRISERYEQEARDIERQESAAAANRAETSLQTEFQLRMLQAEGDLCKQRQEEMSIVSYYNYASENTEAEIHQIKADTQQHQNGLTATHSETIERVVDEYQTHDQQLHDVHMLTQETTRHEIEIAADEKSKTEAMVRQTQQNAIINSSICQNLTNELSENQK